MKEWSHSSVGLPALVLAIAVLVPVVATGQSAETQAAGSGNVTRTSWGDPDLRGTWTSNGARGVPMERPKEVLTAADEARQEVLREFSRNDQTLNVLFVEPETDITQHFDKPPVLVVDPPNGRIPFTPELQAASDSWKAASHGVGIDSWEDLDLWDRCITKGGPPMNVLPAAYNNGILILQTSDHVAILHEIIHEVRIIPLDGRDHLDPRIHQYWGDSRAHWEGDTLVVEVTNYSDKTFGTQQPKGSYRGGGRGQRVVERFTRIDDGTLEYRATVEDPRGFTKPWTVVVPLLRDDDYVLYEYACHEGNYGLEQILKAHLGPGTSDSDGR